MTTYVVGDLQGCLAPLQCLMEQVNFDPQRDYLWSVGDLINRGPQCLKTLRFLYQMRDRFKMVLGNHDLHLLAVANGTRAPHSSDTIGTILNAPDRDELLHWLTQQPLMHVEDDYAMVHAGIPPQWSIEEAKGYAQEVEAVLRTERRSDFFDAMYGNKPDSWEPGLTGMARLRVITNYLTRMRYCTASGRLDMQRKGPPPVNASLDGEALAPWFSFRDAAQTLLFGHWASLQGQTGRDDIIGLDTGCVWGGQLSFYALESAQWIRCDCTEFRSIP